MTPRFLKLGSFCLLVLGIALGIPTSSVESKTPVVFSSGFRPKPSPIFGSFTPGEEVSTLWARPGRAGFTVMRFGVLRGGEQQIRLWAPNDWTENPEFDWMGSVQNILSFEFGSKVRVGVRHSAMVHQYYRNGYSDEYGSYSYPIFEQRLTLGLEVPINDQWWLSVPATLQQKKYANFREGARRNDAWAYSAWLTPELGLNLGKGSYISVGYETDTFVGWDLNEFYFVDSIAAGIPYMRLSVTF